MRRTRSLFILIVACLLPIFSQAQNGTIAGQVDAGGKGVATATISLLHATDSAWVRSQISDDSGKFSFKDVIPGNYLLSVTALGYATRLSPQEVNANKTTHCDIVLNTDATLADVTVTGKRPFIEMSLGKTVINIEGSPAAAGSNVLELLRRLPGITVDMNGNISMAGKEGVLVLIDDRPTYLSSDQLADYLKTIQADEVSKMELITQPSAKYDAAGNAGIINIRLKKNRDKGLNGSISYLFGQGVYPFGEGSVSLNLRKKKVNYFLNASKLDAIGFANWNQDQYFIDPATGAETGHAHIHSYPLEHFGVASVRAGADYDATDKTKVGFSARGSYHPNYNHYNIYTNTVDANRDTTSNITRSTDGFIRKDIMANAYADHQFSKQCDLVVNLDYLTFSDQPRQEMDGTTYNSLMQPLPYPLIQRSWQPSQITVYSVKADYSATLSDGLKLEAGLKSSLVNTGNDAQFSIFEGGNWIKDTMRSNRFLYHENINALYASMDKSLGTKWEVRAGLRGENTNANGRQDVHNDAFDRNYVSLFPTAFISYKADKNNTFEITYGRRIDRPDYRSLNPFRYYSFEGNYRVGNPDLRPQFTNNVELKHSYRHMLITTLSVSGTTDVLEDLLRIDTATRVQSSMPVNFKENRYIFCSVLFNKDVFKWWSLNISGNWRAGFYDGTDGRSEVKASGNGYGLDLNSQFDPAKGWKGEVTLYYQSYWRGSVIESIDPSVYMVFGLSKKVGEHFLIKAAASDPFNLYRISMHDRVYNYRSDASYTYASMRFDIGLTWTFGSNDAHARKAERPEEANRMKID